MGVRVTFFIALLTLGCRAPLDLRNKYLIYTQTISDNTRFYPEFFYASFNDTIFIAHEKFGTVHDTSWFVNVETGDSTRYVTGTIVATVYRVARKKDGIYYTHLFGDGTVDSFKRFTNVVGDTFRVGRKYPSRFYTLNTINTGFDTTIVFYNHKLKCRKYLEIDYAHYPDTPVTQYYLEKKSLLPVMIVKPERWRDRNKKRKLPYTTYILRYYVDRKEVKSTDWSNPWELGD